eukprot:Gb_17360 [translate_table: standard]
MGAGAESAGEEGAAGNPNYAPVGKFAIDEVKERECQTLCWSPWDCMAPMSRDLLELPENLQAMRTGRAAPSYLLLFWLKIERDNRGQPQSFTDRMLDLHSVGGGRPFIHSLISGNVFFSMEVISVANSMSANLFVSHLIYLIS